MPSRPPPRSNDCLFSACLFSFGSFQNTQLSISLGKACPAARVRQAWQQVTAHYGVLRSSFFKVPAGDFVYREHDGIEASWQLLDWTKLTKTSLKVHPAIRLPGSLCCSCTLGRTLPHSSSL